MQPVTHIQHGSTLNFVSADTTFVIKRIEGLVLFKLEPKLTERHLFGTLKPLLFIVRKIKLWRPIEY